MMNMRKLLLTGFVPFLDHPINPSERIVSALDGQVIGEFEVVGRVLPVDFSKSGIKLIEMFEEVQPDAVICLGLSAGRERVTPERVAINCNDGETDNTGVGHQDQPIVEGGPAAYFSTLPIRSMVDCLRENGLPSDISNTAGTYLCNNVMYHVLHHTKQKELSVPAGFIHIPASHELAINSKRSIPSWSMDSLVTAIRLAIGTLSS
jgi:pyroglutamyl-peptidase